MGSTKHFMDWSYNSITPHDFRDIVTSSDLSRVEHMGAQAMATVSPLLLTYFSFLCLYIICLTPCHFQGNAYFLVAIHHFKSWKKSLNSKEKDLNKLKIKYRGLEEKTKNKEEELADAHAELIQLRDERDGIIDAYMEKE